MNLGALFLAIVMVESGGDINAVGDHGRAHGPAQIRQAALEDFNRWTAEFHSLTDCKDLALSRRVFFSYINHYCTAKRLGRRPTSQDAARIWNGGPDGWREPATCLYWKRVAKQLRGEYASNNPHRYQAVRSGRISGHYINAGRRLPRAHGYHLVPGCRQNPIVFTP